MQTYLKSLNPEELSRLSSNWEEMVARDNQLPPDGAWTIWLVMAGRGFGKTRTGAQFVQRRVEDGLARRVNLVAATAGDARDTMLEGESGLLTIAPKWFRPTYEPSKRRLTWPNWAVGSVYSADNPDRLRGPQCDTFWADELAAWRYPAAWDQLMFGFRLGQHPQGVVTTTPRPTPVIKGLVNRSDVVVTRGTTYDNRANLADAFFREIIRNYEGTRLGRQELNAEILKDNPRALWQRDRIDKLRCTESPGLRRVVVAIDPAVSSNEHSDETGIVVVGLGEDGHGYVLDDASGTYTPAQWAARAVSAFDRNRADRVVAEVNNGGDLVEANLRTARSTIPYTSVRASRGKQTRAEPISALYEQGRVHHVGCLHILEDQMCSWDPTSDTYSPDRVDALVWGLTALDMAAPQSTYSSHIYTSTW